MKKLLVLATLFISGCTTLSSAEISSVCEDEVKYGSKFSSYSQCVNYHQGGKWLDAFSSPQAQSWVDSVTTKPKERIVEKSVDMKCMRDCRSFGYQYDYCESRCSY